MRLETIWSEYQNSLKAFLHKNISDPNDVEDLLQDILLQTHLNLHKIKDITKVKSWIFQVANNSIINLYRQRGTNKAKISELELWNEQDESTLFTQLSHCITPFINGLSDKDVEILTAIEIEGVSQKEYAATHDIKYSTLKSRVKKSRENLLKVFNGCCQFSIDKKGNLTEFTRKNNRCSRC